MQGLVQLDPVVGDNTHTPLTKPPSLPTQDGVRSLRSEQPALALHFEVGGRTPKRRRVARAVVACHDNDTP